MSTSYIVVCLLCQIQESGEYVIGPAKMDQMDTQNLTTFLKLVAS